MAIQLERISLPRGPGSLAQLTQHGTHVLRVDRSGPALLIDLGGKKPVAHELPMTILKSQTSEPDAGLVIESGVFSAKGEQLILLRGGTDRLGGRAPAVELVNVATRELVSSFPLGLKNPVAVDAHPDGERLFVASDGEAVVMSMKGKVLERIAARSFELNPSGTHVLLQLTDDAFLVRPLAGKKGVKFEASEATWSDDQTLVAVTWKSSEEDVVHRVDAATGKLKRVATIPSVSALAAHGNHAVATNVQGKKVLATWVELSSGKTQKFELVGSPSGTQVSAGPHGAFIAVNWQKVLHVLSDGAEVKKAAPAAKKPVPLPAGHGALISRIEEKAKAAGVTLAKGASAKSIAAAEKTLGVTLPAEVKAFYLAHDGSEDDATVEDRELLSLERMVGEWKIWKGLLDGGDFGDNDHGEPGKGVQKKWWIREWIPVTYDGSGNHHMIDLAPGKSGSNGQILSFWHDDAPREVEGKDLLSWLAGAEWGDPDRVEEAESSAQSGNFVRYEMAQKFWEVALEGSAFTVRYGKKGTGGQEQVKDFGDAAAAKKEHDKLVASKVKKGYRAV